MSWRWHVEDFRTGQSFRGEAIGPASARTDAAACLKALGRLVGVKATVSAPDGRSGWNARPGVRRVDWQPWSVEA